jgi:hypothetical protein
MTPVFSPFRRACGELQKRSLPGDCRRHKSVRCVAPRRDGAAVGGRKPAVSQRCFERSQGFRRWVDRNPPPLAATLQALARYRSTDKPGTTRRDFALTVYTSRAVENSFGGPAAESDGLGLCKLEVIDRTWVDLSGDRVAHELAGDASMAANANGAEP